MNPVQSNLPPTIIETGDRQSSDSATTIQIIPAKKAARRRRMRPIQSLNDKIQKASERIEKERAEFNFRSIQAFVPVGSRVLDVGAWSCYLGQMLRDRLQCEVLSLDVVDANKTDMPFQVFDGKVLPVESGSFDVVLLLYVLHHAAEDHPLLEEAHRVLRDGGLVLVAEDSIDGLWNKILTIGFHLYLWLVTRMTCDGKFRTTPEWRQRFQAAGFTLHQTLPLGHHLRRVLWPNNVLFVLEKSSATIPRRSTS